MLPGELAFVHPCRQPEAIPVETFSFPDVGGEFARLLGQWASFKAFFQLGELVKHLAEVRPVMIK